MSYIKSLGLYLFVLGLPYTYSTVNATEDVNEDVEDEDLEEIDEDNKDSKDKEDDNYTEDSLEEDNETEKSNNENKGENNKEKEDTNKSEENKNKNAVSGWYSGLNVSFVPTNLVANETKQDSKPIDYRIKNNIVNPSMILGYDFLLDKLVFGGECNIGFNFGSPTNYKDKVYNQEIGDLKKGINFVGTIRLGVAIKSWVFYGKLGGNLSKWKYTWKIDNNKDETKYNIGWLYGGGIEKQFSNNIYVRTEFSYSPNVTHNDTKKKVNDCNLDDVKTNNYQISIGGGYRF